jgi:hypothetical protein
MAATKNASGLFAARFFLGCFETGIGPSAVSYNAFNEESSIPITDNGSYYSLLYFHSGIEEKK